jgi:hypothetical protein
MGLSCFSRNETYHLILVVGLTRFRGHFPKADTMAGLQGAALNLVGSLIPAGNSHPQNVAPVAHPSVQRARHPASTRLLSGSLLTPTPTLLHAWVKVSRVGILSASYPSGSSRNRCWFGPTKQLNENWLN